ncbi:hypothetical protein LPJ61_003898, partial [Coemansia biformis]
KALDKAASDFGLPLSGEHYFAGVEFGGVQQLAIQLKDMHGMYAAHCARLIQGIEADTLGQLDGLRTEIKKHLKAYADHLAPHYRRLRKQAKEVDGCKDKLVRAVETYEKKGRGQDVWLVRQCVRRELVKQAALENALHRAVQAEHGRLLGWETMMASRLRDIVAGVVASERASLHACTGTADNFAAILDRFDPSTEPRMFDQRFGSALRLPLGLNGNSSLEDCDYMYRDCRVADVLLEGPVERERGMIKRFQPSYVVLTAQGYLHCYSDKLHLLEKSPDLSLDLAACGVVSLDDACMFVVVVGDKKLGRSRYAFRGANPAVTSNWVSAIASVAARQPAPTPPRVDSTIRGTQMADDAEHAAGTPPTAAHSLDEDTAAREAAAATSSWERSPVPSVAEDPASRQDSQADDHGSRSVGSQNQPAHGHEDAEPHSVGEDAAASALPTADGASRPEDGNTGDAGMVLPAHDVAHQPAPAQDTPHHPMPEPYGGMPPTSG